MKLVLTLLLSSSLSCTIVAFQYVTLPKKNKIPVPVRSRLYETSTDKSSSSDDDDRKAEPKKVVIIGGGWAGFSAADALADATSRDGKSGAEVINIEMLDASPRGPGGLAGGWRTPKLGMPVEAGIHGFWREYKNTFAAIERIGLNLDDVLTPYTPSILVSQSGRVAVAPVLGSGDDEDSSSPLTNFGGSINSNIGLEELSNPKKLLSKFSKLLPPPLDVALLSDFDESNPLDVVDRLSALGLLGVWADFEQESPESWKRYDRISADNLFRSVAGVSSRLYQELVSPLLHVLPMTPGYDCSAAAALSCFHVFALQGRGAFDVRWCRGTISEKIFNPWTEQLVQKGNVNIRGNSKVTAIEEISSDSMDNNNNEGDNKNNNNKLKVTVNDNESIICDAIILAVGGTALKRLVQTSPVLQNIPNSNEWNNFRGITCVAVRFFFNVTSSTSASSSSNTSTTSMSFQNAIAKTMKESPVVVCGPNIGKISQLTETGFCIYDLQRLQDEFANMNNHDKDNDNNSDDASIMALEIDFFRADTMANIQDDMEIARIALRAMTSALSIKLANDDDSSSSSSSSSDSKGDHNDDDNENSISIHESLNELLNEQHLVDVSVVRAKDAVSHFCVNSTSFLPDNVKLTDTVYICGDYIDRTGHSSWSTEKSVVTGRQSAQMLLSSKNFQLQTTATTTTTTGSTATTTTNDGGIIPAAPDTVQLATLRRLARLFRKATDIIPIIGKREEDDDNERKSPLFLPSPPWVLARRLSSGGRF